MDVKIIATTLKKIYSNKKIFKNHYKNFSKKNFYYMKNLIKTINKNFSKKITI